MNHPNPKIGEAFLMEYSLKFKKITKFTSPIGYFHGLRLVVVAKNVREAIKALKKWHTDGIPEGVKATNLGMCVKIQA